MNKVFVVGMGMSFSDLTAAQLEVIHSAQILMGGHRHLGVFADLPVEKEVIAGRVEETIEFIKARRKDRLIVVLASGDPLLFGIGARITQELGGDNVTVMPNISSVAGAFARLGEPWSDAEIISLHGRDRRYALLYALKSGRAVAVLTDHKQSAQWLAQWLLDKGVDHAQMAVFEKLGLSEETFDWYALKQAAGKTFAQPNIVIIKNAQGTADIDEPALGMPDNAYLHEAGLITKPEVRAVALAKLCLRPGLTLWDLGAGSGAVGIEASVLLGPGRIIAVEQNAGRVEQIRQNARRYGVYNHDVIHRKLPEGLETLPPPERIFIGGGGRDLAAIVHSAVGFLKPGGVLVVNTVLLDNLTRVVETMSSNGLTAEVVQMQVSRSKRMPWSLRLEAGNPVWIVTGRERI